MEEISRIDDFVADRTIARTTEANYRHYLTRAFTWMSESGIDLKTVSVKQVKDWIDAEGFGNSAAYLIATVLRLFCTWLYGDSHTLARLRIKRIESPPQRTLNRSQVDSIMLLLESPISAEHDEELFNARRLRNLALFSLALDTGLRASEIAGAKVENLHIEERNLQIFGKGRKWRKVIFSTRTAEILAEWLTVRTGYASAGIDTVFIGMGKKTSTTGRPLTRWGVSEIVGKVGAKVGIKVSAHALRRSFATISIQNGAPTRLVQIQGGWATIAMVERYTRKLEVEDFDRFFATGENRHVINNPS